MLVKKKMFPYTSSIKLYFYCLPGKSKYKLYNECPKQAPYIWGLAERRKLLKPGLRFYMYTPHGR